MRFKIYRLIDPRTNEVRYIGITIKSLEERLGGHIYWARGGFHSHCSRWVRQLLDLALQPRIELIEETDDQQRERFWIHHHITHGSRLTNITPGGDRVFGMPSPLKGRPLSEARRKAISDALKGRPLSDAHRKATGDGRRGKPLSDAHRDALSEAAREAHARRWEQKHS